MPIEQKILAGNCEITTGAFTPTTAMPTFQGENNAVRMEITFFNDGAAYNIPSSVDVRAHLYYAARPAMTQSLQMEVVGNLATLDVSDLFTAVSGTPLMVVRLIDSNGDIQVSCAFGVNVKPTLSGTVIYLLPPSPDEIIYVGRSPYVGNNGNWWTFDNDLHVFVDSGYAATGNYYVFAKWSAVSPTQDSDMQDTPADWIGWYTGPAMTAPAHYTDYVWFLQKGATGASGTNGADGDDGVGIVSVAKTSTVGLVDTYTITYTDATTSTFTVTNGADGADGATGANGTNAYVHIKWSAVNPTQNSDMTETPSAYIGIYSGASASPPSDYTSYAWYQYKGADGEQGSPGAGLPTGGAVNQIPVKSSATDYATAWGNAILQYSTMPTAAAGLVGQIGQFTGTTGAYTNGYTYICQSDGGAGYEWAEHTTGDYAASVQGIPAGGTTGQALVKSSATDYATEWGNTQLQYSTMPTAAIGNLGWIVTFTGTTDASYTHGHVYECVSSGGSSPIYSWSELFVAGVDYTTPSTVAMLTAGGAYTGGAVTAQASPDQTVAVSAAAYITDEGKRFALSAVSALAADAANGENPRIDIVYGSGEGVITYLAGTAAGSPAQPTTPAHGVLLASIARAANDNTIAAGDITDKRTFVTTRLTKGTWTPVVIPVAGAITSYTINQAMYRISDDMVTIFVSITITNKGTGVGGFYFTLPFPANGASPMYGREQATTGKMLQGYLTGNTALILDYANGDPIATNGLYIVSGSYIKSQ